MDKKTQIQKITLIGLAANIVLSVIKFFIGFLGNSQAVVADALHSFSDTSSDLVILFGVKYWTAPPDDSHPYGHQKIESLISIIIGFILLFVAGAIGYNGLVSLQEKNQPELNWIVIIGPLISIIIKEILFKATVKVGIETNSSSLKANAWHHRTDALSSIPVLIAVVASLIDPRLRFLDQIGAIIVSAFIIKVGFQIIFTNINDLLDTGLSKEKISELKKTINNIQNVRGVHKLRTRKLANYIYIDLHLEVDGQLSVILGHDISEEVKHTLIQNNPKIIDVMVHLEPEENS
ncbi:MAG: cation diffusion facilitator family transporter [Desulfobacula sp.]|uniref:cation diffusion facilitator family transporter n=1 Tax=Desulfobacula sp. TaxID=2593537 RepID=UPI0025BCC56D|nr:cation diffusion facilitator family transporter [Desulfobacula sp.]MCD4719053.1 cation diffusion facilitator family transporter [Desulfobacula sp.]